MKVDVITHYDLLVDEGNDPVCDPEPLKQYIETEFAYILIAENNKCNV